MKILCLSVSALLSVAAPVAGAAAAIRRRGRALAISAELFMKRRPAPTGKKVQGSVRRIFLKESPRIRRHFPRRHAPAGRERKKPAGASLKRW